MTLDELRTKIEDGYVIGCNSVDERATVIDCLQEMGFVMDEASEYYLRRRPTIMKFGNVGLGLRNELTLYSDAARKKGPWNSKWIDYADIERLVSSNGIPTMSEEEFASSLHSLLFT